MKFLAYVGWMAVTVAAAVTIGHAVRHFTGDEKLTTYICGLMAGMLIARTGWWDKEK